VSQTASQEREKSPLPEGAEVNLLHLQPEGRGHAFGPSSGRKIEVDLERPSPSGPKGQDQGVTERGKRKELRVTPTPEIDATEEPSQARTPEQPSTKKSADDFDKRGTFLKKPKKDYRRLFLEAGSITIMVLAGGYLLWSVYAHFIRKPPGPGAPVSKDPAGQILPSSSSSAGPVTSTTGPGESKNTVGSSSNPQGAIPSPLSLPDTSKTPSVETQEIGNIKILLENIRRANLQEDIDLFVSCYASDFGNLDGKKKATQAYWKNFNYLELSYDLKDPSISADTARARVEWLIKTSSKTGGRLEQNKSILDVTLKKEEGGWKIKEVKPVR
jgi:hypothetical protein